jgi:hypothetical protein
MSVLLCPKCGNALKWACDKDEGEAYCSALQSRVVHSEAVSETLCNFVGKVRRISHSEVELVPRMKRP